MSDDMDESTDTIPAPRQNRRRVIREEVSEARNAVSPRSQDSRDERTLPRDPREDEDEDQDIGDLIDAQTFDLLPELPPDSEWHYCWWNPNNPRDTLSQRERLGYSVVKPEELPEDVGKHIVRSGDNIGSVNVNEMILLKVSRKRYAQLMEHYHHRKPKESEVAIRETVEEMDESMGLLTAGKRAEIESGYRNLGRADGNTFLGGGNRPRNW